MKKVLILGGGYAGIYALQELAKDKDIQITLVDKHSYHNLQPEVYDLIANKANVADVTIDLSTLCAGFDHPSLHFVNKRVVDCSFDKNRVLCSDGDYLEYDYLLIAIGSRTLFPKTIEGLNNSDDLKKLHRALYFKQSFENDIFEKIDSECQKCQDSHIVVIGAGLSGVEIAAEMADYSSKFFKQGLFACDNMSITLVSGSKDILPGMNETIVRMSTERLEQLGVNIVCDKHMQKCDENFIYLDDNTKLPYSFIVFAGGIEAANLTTKLNLPKNHKGQLEVTKQMQLRAHENVFAAGDVAIVKDGKEQLPPNVTVARESGKIAGKNILALLQNKPMCECKPFIEGTLIALGGRYAVCNLYDKINVKGFIGYLIKQYVFLRYRFPLQKISQKGYKKIQKCNKKTK